MNQRPTWCHLLFYFTYYALNMFRTLIYPSSGACDCADELPHRSSCSQFVVCWSFCCGWYLVVFVLQAEATTDVVIHQHSRKLLKMDILMTETCWAHNKWNKIASDIKLVFHLSSIWWIWLSSDSRFNEGWLNTLATLRKQDQFTSRSCSWIIPPVFAFIQDK